MKDKDMKIIMSKSELSNNDIKYAEVSNAKIRNINLKRKKSSTRLNVIKLFEG
jgi:hypothetical protein